MTDELKTSVLIEALDLTEAVINADARTVRQRIIKSGRSLNNRLYREPVLMEARPLFEGVKTYANHPSKSERADRPERSIRELTGWITDVEYKEGALWGTRHFTRTQAGNDAWSLVEDIVTGKAPATLMGSSINALGKGKLVKDDAGDFLDVESINNVPSVDDVTTPAAGGGFERLVASDSGDMVNELLKLVDYQEWFEARPEFVDKLKREWKTVRLDEESKRLLAESDGKLKTANDRVALLESQLKERETEDTTLQEANAKLTADNEQLRREVVLVETLAKVQLPAEWKKDLRKTLLNESDVSKWESIIETERKKVKSVGGVRVNVSGGGQQVNTPVKPVVKVDPIAEARRRIATAQTPEDLKRIQETLGAT